MGGCSRWTAARRWPRRESSRAGLVVVSALPSGGSTARGVDVGGPGEQWFAGGNVVGDLFFWKGTPVFLGPVAAGGLAPSRVLLANQGGRVSELVESCAGQLVLDVAAAGGRYAAITRTGVVFGDLSSAPDLPSASGR